MSVLTLGDLHVVQLRIVCMHILRSLLVVLEYRMLRIKISCNIHVLILQFKSYFAQLLPKQLLLKDEIASTSTVSYVNIIPMVLIAGTWL